MCGTGSSILLGFVNAREVGVSSRNLVSRTFPQKYSVHVDTYDSILRSRRQDGIPKSCSFIFINRPLLTVPIMHTLIHCTFRFGGMIIFGVRVNVFGIMVVQLATLPCEQFAARLL